MFDTMCKVVTKLGEHDRKLTTVGFMAGAAVAGLAMLTVGGYFFYGAMSAADRRINRLENHVAQLENTLNQCLVLEETEDKDE